MTASRRSQQSPDREGAELMQPMRVPEKQPSLTVGPQLSSVQQSRERLSAEALAKVDEGAKPSEPTRVREWKPSLTVGARLNGARQSRLPVDFGDEPVCTVAVQQRRSLQRIGGAGRPGLQHFRTGPQTNRKSQNGFTLVEILVVLVLLSLIVFALMAVFAGTQKAFRASLTQTDTLEGGRAVMDLIANDLQTMMPSDGISNVELNANGQPVTYGPVNFGVTLAGYFSPPSPLFQSLISSPSSQMRTNLLENIFILSKGNISGVPTWIGTGYSVTTNLADGTLYPLYRFYLTTNVSSGPLGAWGLYNQFIAFQYTNSTEWSHLMDGVVDLTARAYDTGGIWMTNDYVNPSSFHVQNVYFLAPLWGGSQFLFCSNAVPASVQIELGTLEDHTLQHAEALSGLNQSNYLANAAGQVHIFRQRVWIRNLDPTAYEQ